MGHSVYATAVGVGTPEFVVSIHAVSFLSNIGSACVNERSSPFPFSRCQISRCLCEEMWQFLCEMIT